jgi:hypothetical protein
MPNRTAEAYETKIGYKDARNVRRENSRNLYGHHRSCMDIANRLPKGRLGTADSTAL